MVETAGVLYCSTQRKPFDFECLDMHPVLIYTWLSLKHGTQCQLSIFCKTMLAWAKVLFKRDICRREEKSRSGYLSVCGFLRRSMAYFSKADLLRVRAFGRKPMGSSGRESSSGESLLWQGAGCKLSGSKLPIFLSDEWEGSSGKEISV